MSRYPGQLRFCRSHSQWPTSLECNLLFTMPRGHVIASQGRIQHSMTSFGSGNTEQGIAQGEAPARDAHVEGMAGLRGSRHARISKTYQVNRFVYLDRQKRKSQGDYANARDVGQAKGEREA